MRPDFILKNVMVYQTFRQCFEKRDVAVAGEKFYCVSPAISYPGVREIDGKGRYMLPGLVDIHMHIESSMTYPGEFSRITLPYGVTTVVADAHEMANVFGMDGIRAFMAQKTKQSGAVWRRSTCPGEIMQEMSSLRVEHSGSNSSISSCIRSTM